MKVYVKAPDRLHLGALDLEGDVDRLFGGIEVTLMCPM
jgi:predicted sugar kinase